MRYLAAIALLVAGLVWGILSHRYNLFPYPLLRAAATFVKVKNHPPGTVTTRSSRSAQQRLAALGYLNAAPVEEQSDPSGVTRHIEEETQPGLNFYNELATEEALLVDNDGREVFAWRFDPGLGKKWIHAELLPDSGAVIGLVEDDSVVRLSGNSKVEWKVNVRAHHDVAILGDGSIWVLSRQDTTWEERYPGKVLLEDFVTVISPNGELRGEFSLLDPLKGSTYEFLLPSLGDSGGQVAHDILHTNHIEVFDGSIQGGEGLFRKGNILVSYRTINAIAILDGSSHEILWLWGPTNLSVQHHPRLLPSGNILIFDNGFDTSRVVEVSVPGGRIEWSYSDGEQFFSFWGGSVQRLINGSTLVSDTATGRAFEVTPDRRIVWEFFNPRVHHEDQEGAHVRGNIWRMTRYPREALAFLPSSQ